MITMSYEDQVKMFKGNIHIGPRGVDELISILQSKVDIEEIDLRDTPGQTMRNAYFNAEHCINNMDLQLTHENMAFATFKVIQNEKSRIYYQDITDGGEFIHVILERLTGYIASNNNALFTLMIMSRGVSQQEYDTQGFQFQALIASQYIDYSENIT